MNLAHIGISVSDLDSIIKWYKEIFGFEEVKRFEKEIYEIKGAIISNGEMVIELLMPYQLIKKDKPPLSLVEVLRAQGLNHISINVEDVKLYYKKLISQKATLITELIDDRFFFCCDPDNTLIEIRQK